MESIKNANKSVHTQIAISLSKQRIVIKNQCVLGVTTFWTD